MIMQRISNMHQGLYAMIRSRYPHCVAFEGIQHTPYRTDSSHSCRNIQRSDQTFLNSKNSFRLCSSNQFCSISDSNPLRDTLLSFTPTHSFDIYEQNSMKHQSHANRHILNSKAFFHWCSFALVLRNSSKARTESKVPTIKNASDNALLNQSMKSGFCYIQESVRGNSSLKDRCRHRVKPALLQSRECQQWNGA